MRCVGGEQGRSGRRSAILATFIRHVAERGYDQTNLGDIADELHLSKGTIVHHFGTKAQLLRELEETYMLRQLAKLRQIWQRLPAPEERVAALIYAATLLHVLDRHATIATQREVAQLSGDPDLRGVRGLRGEIQHVVRTELHRGVVSRVFRPVDPELATLQIYGASQWMWTWFDPAGPYRPEEIASTYVDVFVGGLLADRRALARLANPNGEIVNCVRSILVS